jgi:hypothetical protein
MLKNITGLTNSTIVFNHLKITLRGKDVARNIDVINDAQKHELSSLVSIGLISVEDVEKKKEIVKEVVVRKEEAKKVDVVIAPIKEDAPVKVAKKRGRPPKKKVESTSTKVSTDSKKTVKPIRSTQSVKSIKAAKRSNEIFDGKIKKTDELDENSSESLAYDPTRHNQDNEPEEREENNRIVMVGESGVMVGKMKRSYAGEIADGEDTQASIDALKKMEDEAKWELDVLNKKGEVPMGDRLGNEAVVSVGNDGCKKVKMKNDSSLVDDGDGDREEAEHDPSFIEYSLKNDQGEDGEPFIET